MGQLSWREYAKKNTPDAAAGLSLMNYREDERVDVKVAIYKILSNLVIPLEQAHFILCFTEHNLHLNPEEQVRFTECLAEQLSCEQLARLMFYEITL